MEDNFKAIRKFNLWDGNSFPLGMLRPKYTEKIEQFVGSQLIKVLVGQRRVGKSYLLKQLCMKLIKELGVPRANILYINLEFLEFDFLKTYKDLEALFQWYKQELKPKGKVYLFIDEVQSVQDWEKFVNSHAQDFVEEVELFITGSNSKMLSSELATLLSGRYIQIEVFPFNYMEYLGITQKENSRGSYLDYLNFGGLPGLFHLSDFESQKLYVSSVKDTILLRDIVARNKIRDVQLLEDLFVYMVNTASNLLSINSLVNYFNSKKRKTTYDTIANFINYIEEAFLIHKCMRYNIKGKEIIGGNAKYYVNDLGFKNLLFTGFGYGMGYLLENRVYLDLKQSGYTLYTGTWDKNEIDFVAQKEDRLLYIQSAYLLEKPETVAREFGNLSKIKDNYEKYVVTLDERNFSQQNGIKHVQAWDLVDLL